MLPVAFNVSAGPHGRGFVRLPEEANGEGCFGSLLLRVLAGSGFSLRWSDTHAVVHAHVHAHANVHDHTAPAAAGAGTGTGIGTGTGTGTGAGAGAGVAGGRRACGCSHVEDASAAEAFRAAVQAFYYRAIAVRDQVRLWPAWKCVSCVEGRSHPGTPNRDWPQCTRQGPLVKFSRRNKRPKWSKAARRGGCGGGDTATPIMWHESMKACPPPLCK